MNTEQAKKATRVFFYGLGIASARTVLSMIIIFFTAHWEDMWPIVVITTFAAATAVLFKLANWAFSPSPQPYRDSSTVPTYANGKFLGDFPSYPAPGDTVGGYTYSPNPKDPKTFVWKKDVN